MLRFVAPKPGERPVDVLLGDPLDLLLLGQIVEDLE